MDSNGQEKGVLGCVALCVATFVWRDRLQRVNGTGLDDVRHWITWDPGETDINGEEAYFALDSACLDEANGHRMDFHAYLEKLSIC